MLDLVKDDMYFINQDNDTINDHLIYLNSTNFIKFIYDSVVESVTIFFDMDSEFSDSLKKELKNLGYDFELCDLIDIRNEKIDYILLG